MNKILFVLVISCVLVAAATADNPRDPKAEKPVKGGAHQPVRASAPEPTNVKGRNPVPVRGNGEKKGKEPEMVALPIAASVLIPPKKIDQAPENTGIVPPRIQNHPEATIQVDSIKGLKEKFQNNKNSEIRP